MIRALLIEDELPAREDLRALLAAHPQVQIVGEAATVDTGRALLTREAYDLVFFDIHLLGGSSFDLVPDVQPGVRIIFTTAYDAFALRAFEVNALDYLVKPIAAARLATALARIAAPETRPDPATAEASAPLRIDDTVYLRTGQRARFASVADISVISAEDNYSTVTLASGDRVLLRKSLSAWDAVLPASHFVRVHRTCIVNLAHLLRYERQGDGALLFIKGAAEPVPASRRTWSDVRTRLAEFHPQL